MFVYGWIIAIESNQRTQRKELCMPPEWQRQWILCNTAGYVHPSRPWSPKRLQHIPESRSYVGKDSREQSQHNLENVCLQNEFPTFVQRRFLSSNNDSPRFYHFIKTHKTGPDIKIRPIVSNSNGPTQRISWLLANALKPMLKDVPTHLEDSFELINCIQSGDVNTNKMLTYPCSLDVVSLYTSIPIQEAITNAVNEFRTEYSTFPSKTLQTFLQSH